MNFIGIKTSNNTIEWVPKYEFKKLPKGFTYIQFPNELSPIDLWGGTDADWENISTSFEGLFPQSEGGCFYRIIGGCSASFGVVQAESTYACGQYLLMSCGCHNHTCRTLKDALNGSGCGYMSVQCQFTSSTNAWTHNHSVVLANCTCGAAFETRPRNYTVRLWRKK